MIALLKAAVERNPQLLNERMKLGEGLDMTPVEMTIRTSYNESLMNFMLSKYLKTFVLTSEDKTKLLSHAKWLSDSTVDSTALMGERLIKKIENPPKAELEHPLDAELGPLKARLERYLNILR